MEKHDRGHLAEIGTLAALARFDANRDAHLNDLVALCRGESSATKPDCVQAKNIIGLSSDHERRDVLAEGGCALCDREPPDSHVLMKDAAASEKCAIANRNIPTQ